MLRSLDDTMALMLSRSLNERFGEPLVGLRLHESAGMTCPGCGGLMEVTGDTCTQCGLMQAALDQAAPPGRERQVKALKRKKGVKNPWAIAWASYNEE